MCKAVARSDGVAEACLREAGRGEGQRIVRLLGRHEILQRAPAVVLVHTITAAKHAQLRIIRRRADRLLQQTQRTRTSR